MHSDLEVVGKYRFEYEAQVARMALQAAGIRGEVMADNAGGMLPSLQILFPVRLLVLREDAERAREVLEGRERGAGSPESEWSGEGEESAGAFDEGGDGDEVDDGGVR